MVGFKFCNVLIQLRLRCQDKNPVFKKGKVMIAILAGNGLKMKTDGAVITGVGNL